MPELVIHTAQGDQRLSFSGFPLLHDLLAPLPDAPLLSCGGRGVCGRCAVAARGNLDPPPDDSGHVLSCRSLVTGNAEVWLPRRRILTGIETRTRVSGFPLSPMEGEYGAAVDLGTTTIVLQLLHLPDGKNLSAVSCENPQRMLASDVIGRIDTALKGGLPVLKNLVRSCVDTLEKEAFARAGLRGRLADVRVITGNTTMLYLFSGRMPASLAAAPFQADCLFGMREGRDVLPPCMSAFVGADITCAVLASRMVQKPETALLMDVGTNGEIALWHRGVLRCCAAAAGPAFEGGGISCGTAGVPGAVDSVSAENGCLAYTTLQSAPACGLCGSGLIDLIAALLETGQIDETGFLEKDVQLAEGVTLTRQDVRQVQLAKGAIAAGIRTLLREAAVSVDEVETLYIAGGFGSRLNLKSAARIGLIPAELVPRAEVLGNASLDGACRLLLSEAYRKEAAETAKNARCLNAASCPGFSEDFVACMLFETE